MVKTEMWVDDYVQFNADDVVHATQSLIAVSSILMAFVDQYATTGQVHIGPVQHCGNVIDQTIERLGLAELAITQKKIPF